MKSRTTLASFAFLLATSTLIVAACQSDDPSNPIDPAGGPGAGGTSAGGTSNGGTTGNPGGSTGNPGGAAGNGGSDPAGGTAGTSGGDPCSGTPSTLVDLNKAKAPLPEGRLRFTGLVATSHKILISPSKSGCLWGVYVTTAGADVSEYGSIVLTSKGEVPVTDEAGKSTCGEAQQDKQIPKDVAPGDILDFSGYLEEFLQNSCGQPATNQPGVINPKPEAGQRQLTGTSCFTKTGTGPVPKAHPLDLAALDAIAAGKNTDDVFYKWGGGLVEMSNLTSKQLPTEKYSNCTAVSGFGDLNFEETALTVNNAAMYNDVTCLGPKDNNKRYDFQHPATFTSIVGLLAVDFCTWQVSVANRCDSFAPASPTCTKIAGGDLCSKITGTTACAAGSNEDTLEQCTDQVDNNGNGFVDCNDFACCDLVDCKTTAPDSGCAKKGSGGSGGSGGGSGENTTELCTDKADNDGDNFVDCNDKECCKVVDCSDQPDSFCGKLPPSTPETTVALCTDKADNDGDNFIDCNDKDCCKLVDCSGEPTSYCAKQGSGGAGGSSGTPENTAALCADTLDNDGDKFIDCEDKDCCKVVDCKTTAPTSFCGKLGVENTATLCADKIDNDGDKFIDCEDKDCCSLVDCKTTAPTSFCGKL